MKDFAERQEEHSRRMDELREDFNRGFAQQSREIREVDLHVSSISRGDVSLFQRKVAFYEREEKVEVKRTILISPYFDLGAEELARDLGIETYTSGREVRM
jgi:hypothetical protein